DLDLAITAAAPGEAPAIDAVGKFSTFERPMLTMPFNVTGTPAMSVCCGYSEAGLPLAFQLAGKPFEEGTVLRAAHAYEKATSWLGQANGCAMTAALLDPEVAREIFGDRRGIVAWGPPGPAEARAVAGGYRLTGTWSFASGSHHATWLGAHVAILGEDGSPQ